MLLLNILVKYLQATYLLMYHYAHIMPHRYISTFPGSWAKMIDVPVFCSPHSPSKWGRDLISGMCHYS